MMKNRSMFIILLSFLLLSANVFAGNPAGVKGKTHLENESKIVGDEFLDEEIAIWEKGDDNLKLQLGQIAAKGEYGLKQGEDGVALYGEIEGEANLAKLGGQYEKSVDLTDDLSLNAGIKSDATIGLEGKGSAFIGAKDGQYGMGVGGEAFAGAKIDGELSGGFYSKYLGISVKGTVQGEVSAGAGATAKLLGMYDNGELIISAELAATLGFGAGAGGGVVINVADFLDSEFVDDADAIARYVADQVDDAFDSLGDLLDSFADTVENVVNDIDETILNAAGGVIDQVDDLISLISATPITPWLSYSSWRTGISKPWIPGMAMPWTPWRSYTPEIPVWAMPWLPEDGGKPVNDGGDSGDDGGDSGDKHKYLPDLVDPPIPDVPNPGKEPEAGGGYQPGKKGKSQDYRRVTEPYSK